MSKKAKLITINGESLTPQEWADRLGITRVAMYKRLKKGLTDDHLLAKRYEFVYPLQRRGRPGSKIRAHDQEKTIAEWSRETGASTRTIYERLKNGWTPEDAVTTPAHNSLLTIKGKTQKKRDWSKDAGITVSGFHWRIRNVSDSLKKLLRKRNKRAPYGEMKNIIRDYLSTVDCEEAKVIAEELGLNKITVSKTLTENPDLFVIDHTIKRETIGTGVVKINIWRLKQ